MKSKLQKEQKSKDQEGAVNVIGTILLLLSGLILYIDKVVDYLNVQVNHIPYYETLDVFLWTIGGTVSPLLICLGYIFKGEKWALSAPVTAYCAQLTLIFKDVNWILDDYFWLYTGLFAIGFLVLSYFIKNYANTIYTLKRNIRFVMNLMVVKSINDEHIKDIEVYTEQIVKPAINKLSE